MDYSRRTFGKIALAGVPSLSALSSSALAQSAAKPNRFLSSGVQFGLQPFCYHDLAMNRENRPTLVKRLVQNGLGMVELHATWCEPRYLTDTDKRPQGYGSINHPVGSVEYSRRAIDYKNGNVVWKHATQAGARGLLTTAVGLLFGSDGMGDFVAFDPEDGNPLWHAGIGNTANAPSTFLLDGRHYVVVGVGDSLYASYLP